MTSIDVIDAKILHHQEKIDSSLRKGIQILASAKALTPIDSFNTYQIFAYNLRSLKSHELALEYAKTAIKIADNAFAPSKRFENTKWISTYYFAVGEYENALTITKKDITATLNKGDTLSLFKLYNDVGFIYYRDNQLDSAIHYYQKIINSNSNSKNFQGLIGLATGNLGAVYMKKKEYKTAIEYFNIDANISKDKNISSFYNAIVATAECYYLLKQYAKSISKLDELNSLSNEQKKNIEWSSVLKRHELYMDSYAELNNNKSSIYHMRKLNHLKDSASQKDFQLVLLHKNISDYKISGIQKDLELSSSKIELIESRKQNLNALILILIILFFLVSIIIVAYLNRQKKIKEIQRLKHEVTALELDNKKKDLSNVASSLSFIRSFIDDALDKIKNIHKQPTENIKHEVDTLLKDFKRFQNSDNSLAVLQTDIEIINTEFFSKLEKKHPELTQNERELCGMFLLNMTSKDIAIIRNISPNAVKKARQRLRKKLPISDKDDLISFLQKI